MLKIGTILKDFYKIISLDEIRDQKYLVVISINKNHEIFKGHFPDNPIIPGVCMIQIIKEITEKIVGCNLFMKLVSDVKFIALINPNDNPELRIELEISPINEDEIKVKSITLFGETTALKCNNTYSKIVL